MAKQTSKSSEPKDILGTALLPDGISMSDLKEFYDVANDEYSGPRRRMFLLDGADRGQLWKTITAKFPSYQVLPETNHVNYIKENLVSSIYTVGKSAMLIPRAQKDIDVCNKLNMVYDKIWAQIGVSNYQLKAGDRAALFNIGITQAGWRNSIIGGTKDFLYKGDVVLKNIDPQKFMRDPYADSDDNAQYMMTWDDYHISKIRSLPIYKDRIAELRKTLGDDLGNDGSTLAYEDSSTRAKDAKIQKNYHRVISYWVRITNEAGKEEIWEIHTLNQRYVLYANKSFMDEFPFAILYCNEPGNDLIGVSEPAKIFSNYIAYNMLNSIIATHAYKAQRPPRFLNIQSGINIRQFAQHGADADKTWLVNGDASQAVHYGKFPDLPVSMDMLPSKLDYDIKDKSGIDDMYAGKDFGSVTTTGGTDNVISRTTGRDLVKIQLYEKYTKKLTLLITRFLIKFGDKRVYAIKDKTSNSITDVVIDFKLIEDDTKFDAELSIQSELPKNKQRLAQAANILLEKQMQYNPQPAVITNEEWLLMQDIPFKSLIFDRLKIERNAQSTEDVTKVLFEFAGLIEQGIDPDQALQMVVQSVEAEKNPKAEMEEGPVAPMQGPQAAQLGNTGGSQSFQDMK
jgi:hypothetical protein